MYSLLTIASFIGSTVASIQVSANGAITVDDVTFQPQDIITRDVAILGGGSTGTYAAIRLSKDLGKTVVVVEKSGILGGHTNTYIDPVTGYPFDYGVVAWHNFSTVTNFFARFNVALSPVPLTSPFIKKVANFRTGQYIPNAAQPSSEAIATALGTWYSICAKYPTLPFGYNLTYPVDEELLQPFSDTVTKYQLQAIVPFIWQFSHAIGNMMSQSTLYVIQNFGLPQLANDFLTTTLHFNSEIYLKAAAALGPDVLFNSTASKISRNAHAGYQFISVKTANGKGKKLIKAKKILVTFAPTLDNMGPFSLDHDEHSLFRQFISSPYYAGIIRNGINDAVDVANIDPTAPFNIPLAPFVTMLDYYGIPGLHHFYAEFTAPQTEDQVKKFVLKAVAPLANASLPNASLEVLSDHSPTGMRFTPQAIRDGAYRNMSALQGHHSTFYTGLAWAPDDSGLLWRYTDLTVLPALVASLA